MRQRLKVILDYDDVLVSCNDAAISLLNKEKGTNYNIYDIKDWGLTGGGIDERLKYFADPKFIKSLPLLDGSQEFVKRLSKKAEVFIMTNVEPQCSSERFNHIVRYFPEIKPSNIIIGGRKDLIQADVMLDDAFHNLENAQVSYPVLFQRPWNYGKAGVLSVNGYEEFLEFIDIIRSNTDDEDDQVEVLSLIGPSGSRKKELAEELIKTGKFERVQTYTTKNDKNYHNLSFSEFTCRKDAGFFSETSVYMGEYYGMRLSDITPILEKGKIPLMILDINGAVSVRQHFKSLNVFVKATKEDCIKDILIRNLPIDEAVQRIASLDIELKNEELCDMTVSYLESEKILKKVGVL